MNFLFLTSSLFSSFSQLDEGLDNLDKFLSKIENEDFNISDLMQLDTPKKVHVFSFNIPVTDPASFQYDSENPRSNMYSAIIRLEVELSNIKEKILYLEPLKTSLRNKINNMAKDCSEKRGQENILCKESMKSFRNEYKKYKSWMEDYKKEKDRIMSELAKYHKKSN